jgi:Bacterial capsule synthesis protein PGA_cap
MTLGALAQENKTLPNLPALELGFAGDISLARGVARNLRGDWHAAFEQIKPFVSRLDLAFANLESPLTSQPFRGTGVDLRARVGAVRALEYAGFDVLSTLHNHSLDGGLVGYKESLGVLARFGLLPLSSQTRTVVRGAWKIAFVAFFDDRRSWDMSTVKKARASHDLVIVSADWGVEYAGVTPRQHELALALSKAGADLIIGHGSHVLQPVEYVGQTLVAFGLGNFLFDQELPSTRLGALLKVGVSRHAGRLRWQVSAVPTGAYAGRVSEISGERATEVLNQLKVPKATSLPWTVFQALGTGFVSTTSPRPQQVVQKYLSCPKRHWKASWEILDGILADITGDERPECVALVWRPWQDWFTAPWRTGQSPIKNHRDARGDSAQVAVLKASSNQSIWFGSALARPAIAMRVGDVINDKKLELVTLEGEYVSGRRGPAQRVKVWGWNGFGFGLIWESPPSRYTGLELGATVGGHQLILVR